MSRRVQKLEIDGAAGGLEARLDWPAAPVRGAALVCHPHPLHGGNMHTKAVARTARGLVAAGIATLRFDFRGVGHSAGHFTGGAGELDDATRALRRLADLVRTSSFFLGGFSFGAWIALQLGCSAAPPVRIAGLLAVAPPLDRFDFSFLEVSRTPLLLVAGDADPFCPAARLHALRSRLAAPVTLRLLPGTAHLLQERLPELEETVQHFVQDLLPAPDGEPS